MPPVWSSHPVMVSFNHQINGLESFAKQVSIRICLDLVALWACQWVIVLIIGKALLLWGQHPLNRGILDCAGVEKVS